MQELNNDKVAIENPIYRQILDEFMQHYKESNFFSSVYFQHHPNTIISQLAVDLIVDKYQLSRIYSKKTISENVVQEVQQDETEILPELVQRLLYELKDTIVNETLDRLQKKLAQAEEEQNWDMQIVLLEQLTQLQPLVQQISQALGNRTLSPWYKLNKN